MNAADTSRAASGNSPEIRLRARPVSRGVAIGRIICLYGNNRQYSRIEIGEAGVGPEILRLRAAINLAKRQLGKIVSRKDDIMSGSIPGIFESHRLLIEDSSLQSNIEEEIARQRINAEWAVKLVAESYVARFKAAEDEHFRDRYIDVEDVADRILAALGGGAAPRIRAAKNAIIAAKELRPSTLVELVRDRPAAVITENGGWTSHTFILAREMNWPAVTGVKKLLRRVKDGDNVIVDGYNGVIIVDPGEETLAHYSAAAAEFHEEHLTDSNEAPEPVKTLDGRRVILYANSDTPAAYDLARRLGAEGIGLYRSEFLFNRSKGFPAESEQVEAYRSIADAVGAGGVKIRTFDIGADQILDQNLSKEKNSALGLRAIRLGLAYKKLLKTQLRAILRASAGRTIDIIIPMVSGVSELLEVREILEQEKSRLAAMGKIIGSPRIGVMIEVPSAVLMVKELVEEADFICLGTNDLIQYLLAVDRDNDAVSGWYRSLHPAVLRAIRSVVDAAAAAGKELVACGEMAGSPYYAPVLIGLGITNLSMNPHSLPRVRKVIAGIAFEETVKLAKSTENIRTVEEVEEIVSGHIRAHWAHLFPRDFPFS